MTSSEEFYAALQTAYDHFNVGLFNCCLPSVLFTIQRQHGMMGYFSPDRWAPSKGKNCHEIAIHPIYVGRATLIELMQTLVHEMTHCWQHCHGKPGRISYHMVRQNGQCWPHAINNRKTWWAEQGNT